MGNVVDAINTPALAVQWLQKFESFLVPLPDDTQVVAIGDSEAGAASSSYNSSSGVAYISRTYLDALDKALSFGAAEATFPRSPGVATGLVASLGSAKTVLTNTRDLILAVQAANPSSAPVAQKLYTRKLALGIAIGTGLLAAIGSFAIFWARKPGSSSLIYPDM